MTEPAPEKQRQLAVRVASAASAAEKEAIRLWIEQLLEIKASALPATQKAKQALAPVLAEVGASLAVQDEFAKLSVVGVGMKTHSGVAATLFKTLADVGVNIDLISTSEIRITVAIDQGKADDAARAIHTAFGLDKA